MWRNATARSRMGHAVVEENPDFCTEQLRKSEALLAKAEEIGQLGCWEHNLVTGENMWSANLCRMLGVDPKAKPSEELFWEILHPDDYEAVRTVIDGAMKHGQEYEYQSRFILPGGEVRTFYTRGKPVLGCGNRVVKRMGVTQDISVRVESDRALLESEERYRDLVESSHDLICTHDLTGRVLSMNELPAQLLGYRREELIGLSIPDRLFHGASELFREYIERIKRDGVATGLMVLMTKSGERRVWEYQNTLRTEGVRAPLVRGMAHDVTEKIKAQKALHESTVRLRALVNSIDQIAFEFGADGTFLDIWTTNESLLFRPRAELLGRRISEVMGEDLGSMYATVFRRVLESGIGEDLEYALQLASGERWFLGRITPIVAPDGTYKSICMLARDITGRKSAESELRHLSGRLLKAQDEERREVAREVHDGVGSYISGLSSALGRIRLFLDDSNPEHRSVIAECSELIQAAGREIRTISYLLHPPTLEVLGLESALTWLVRGFSHSSGIKVSSKIAPSLGRFKPETELTLFRVTQEALNNVFRHSGSKTATLQLFQDSHNVVLEIADSGKGMKSRSIKPTRTLTVGISGMRERVENLRGTFSIESAPGKGCVVRASAPRSDAQLAGNGKQRYCTLL
jgi:two-component system NarL family sensor kinase